ncbi:hypothetical protein FDECE_9203 [Fusarium decemcellulare]|nr:hypothetical protein FDECE_9203 [Fusarium decemcellulare]
MRSHNSRMRIVFAAVTIITTFFFLFTFFHVKLTDGLSIVPLPERPFFYEHDPEPAGREDEDGDDDTAGSTRDYRLLTSIRNNLGFYNKVNVKKTGYKIMNPTLLELPRDSHSRHDFLVIARTLHVDTTINGTDYRLARQVAMFANLTHNKLGRPEIKSNNKWAKLLVPEFAGPEHHCQNQPLMDRYIGPEDMKLFWTRRREPLLIFTYQVDDENLCQGQFLIDARAAVPELVRVLGAEYASKMPPIRFREPVGLRRQPPPGHESYARYQREKNWAPAQSPLSSDDDELLFMVEPGQMFRYASSHSPVEEVLVGANSQQSAVEPPYPLGASPDETWHSVHKMTCVHDVMLSDQNVHQSTPMLGLTLCNRGECEPDDANTVMLGMVQRRHDPPAAPYTWYDRRIVAYSAAQPYRMLSVSKKLSYHGEVDGKYIWTGSMIYYANGTDFPSNHGYLDDEIWLSFGIKDSAAGWMDIKARELVADHYLCQGVPEEYRQHRLNITG